MFDDIMLSTLVILISQHARAAIHRQCREYRQNQDNHPYIAIAHEQSIHLNRPMLSRSLRCCLRRCHGFFRYLIFRFWVMVFCFYIFAFNCSLITYNSQLLNVFHTLLKLSSSIFIVLKQIKTCTSW